MKSIFRLEEIRSYDFEEPWYRDASIGIVGHYSSLEKVMEAIRENNQETWDAEEITKKSKAIFERIPSLFGASLSFC